MRAKVRNNWISVRKRKPFDWMGLWRGGIVGKSLMVSLAGVLISNYGYIVFSRRKINEI